MGEDSQDDAADAELARNIGDWLTAQAFELELELETAVTPLPKDACGAEDPPRSARGVSSSEVTPEGHARR